jgi:putative toxin-antitoxin system antitoxin component (TIGR02293 family)
MTRPAIHRRIRRIPGPGSKTDAYLNAVSREVLNELIESTDLSQKSLAYLFDMTVKTFSSYRNNDRKLSPLNAELASKIMELYEEGKQTFGNLKSFNQWMTTPSPGLDHHVPFDLIQTVTGVGMVMDELKAIQYGAPL